MTKLLVCDIDGTLLKKGESSLKRELIDVIEELKQNNMIFAAASGRQYCEMREIFKGINDIYYVSADGGVVIYNDEILKINPLPKFSVQNLFGKDNLVFHTVKNSYCPPCIYNEIKDKYKENAIELDFLESGGSIGEKRKLYNEFFKDKEVIKISKFGAVYAEVPHCCYEIYKNGEWTEWIKVGAGKGEAVEYLQKMLGVSVRETAVFGDNTNDLGMLRRGAKKYIMSDSKLSGRVFSGINCCDIESELKAFYN